MGIYGLLNRTGAWTLCRVTGALPAAFLNRCAAAGVELLEAKPEGEYALTLRLRAGDLKRAEALARRAGCTLTVLAGGGAPKLGRLLLRRRAAAIGLALVLAALLWSRFYIWEISVTGNESVPTGAILDGLRECGVDLGAFWPAFTSDSLRSRLLAEVPELSWATVNVHGSRAEVIVRERTPKPEIWREQDAGDVVAARAGFVRKVSVLNGTALVRPGSAVAPGEVLISGEVESAFGGMRRTHASGTVLAETWYELTAVCPLHLPRKDCTGETGRRWAVILGKNRWNFYRSSSISPAGCDTIIEEWRLAIPGLFSLPVTLVRETDRAYAAAEAAPDLHASAQAAEEALRNSLARSLGPTGTAEETHISAAAQGELLTVTLRARCLQDIGAERRSGAGSAFP